MDVSEINDLSDRDLNERLYFSNKLLYAELQSLKRNVNYASSDSATRHFSRISSPNVDSFEAKLDKLIADSDR